MAERKHKHKKSSDSDQSLSREDLEMFLKGISSAVKNIAADNKGKGKSVLPHAHDPLKATDWSDDSDFEDQVTVKKNKR